MSFFRNDPFFEDMHRMMRGHMRDMDSFMDPFGFVGGGSTMNDGRHRSPRQQMIDESGAAGSHNGRAHGSTQNRHSTLVQRDPMASMMDQFSFGFGGIMRQMEQMQAQVQTQINNPKSHVFTQSTMISIRPGQDGRPQYYEQTESMSKAGDVKETRRSVRDTVRGVEKMEIGHHIGNRGHVIEKRRDRTTGGQIVENQEFIGLKQDEAQQFDQEWSRATRGALNGEQFVFDEGPHLAIEGSTSKSHRRSHRASPYVTQSPNKKDNKRRVPVHQSKSKPRVEEFEENEPEKKANKGRQGGPKIVELE